MPLCLTTVPLGQESGVWPGPAALPYSMKLATPVRVQLWGLHTQRGWGL